MMHSFHTSDNYSIDVYIFNPFDYSCHVFVADRSNRPVNSLDPVYSLHGRDTFECFKSDVPSMTKEQVIKMFNLK